MSTYEWLSLVAILLGGFWKLISELTKIRETLVGKVDVSSCEHRRETCPLLDRINKLEMRLDAKPSSSSTTQNITI